MLQNIWTSSDRDSWINHAVNSQNYRGASNGYWYHIIPKKSGVLDQDDSRRSSATDALADIIYNSDNVYRSISIGIYDLIIQRITSNSFLREYFMRDFMIMIKGGNAYAFLVPNHSELPFSDLDIVVMINPKISQDLYEKLQSSLRITIFQCLSQHKRTLDNMLFAEHADSNYKYKWMNEEQIEAFKEDHIIAMQNVGMISPFESKEIRNSCSRHSFMLMNSKIYDEKVVKVEIPHFNFCDRIPLRKSPIFCSHNSTIQFSKDGYMRDFELFRMKFNCLSVQENGGLDLGVRINTDESISIDLSLRTNTDRISCDFIDISITGRNDTENIEFWEHGRCMYLQDGVTGIWLGLPDIQTCINDMWKMLNLYDCPESKRDKRTRKMNAMQQVMQQMYYHQPPPPPPPRQHFHSINSGFHRVI